MAHGELLCGAWLGKPAAWQRAGPLLSSKPAQGRRRRGSWVATQTLSSPYSVTQSCGPGSLHGHASQQDPLRRVRCAVCSQNASVEQEVPTQTFSLTDTAPGGNRCTLQQGWTIFKVFFLAATRDLTPSAMSPHPRVPLVHSIPPFLTTAMGPSAWGFPGSRQYQDQDQEMSCALHAAIF